MRVAEDALHLIQRAKTGKTVGIEQVFAASLRRHRQMIANSGTPPNIARPLKSGIKRRFGRQNHPLEFLKTPNRYFMVTVHCGQCGCRSQFHLPCGKRLVGSGARVKWYLLKSKVPRSIIPAKMGIQ